MKRTKHKVEEDSPVRIRTKGKGRVRTHAWKPEYVRMVFKIALLGATQEEIAGILGVNSRTITTWLTTRADFSESYSRGKEKADADVAEALYKRAKGYSHPDVHVTSFQGAVTMTPITKHYPPDTAAIVFYLKNRARDRWTEPDKIGANAHLHLHKDIKLDDISDQELQMMEKLGLKKMLLKGTPEK